MVRQATVQTERLQLQPDETKTVLVKQHKEPRGALWTCKAMPSDQACPIEAEMVGYQFVNKSIIQQMFQLLIHSRGSHRLNG